MNDRIYLEAERLFRKHHTRDPFEIMDAMNIVVQYIRGFPRDGLKGFCMTMHRTQYVVINARLCKEEQRMVGAHELGHLIMHADELRLGAFRDQDVYNATSIAEREANLFAADLLISDEDVLEEMKVHDANFFTVASALSMPIPFFAFKLYRMVDRGHAMRVPIDLDSTFLAKGRY